MEQIPVDTLDDVFDPAISLDGKTLYLLRIWKVVKVELTYINVRMIGKERLG